MQRKQIFLILFTLFIPGIAIRADQLIIHGPQKSYRELFPHQKMTWKEMNLADLFQMKMAQRPIHVGIIAPPHNRIFRGSYVKGVLITYHSYKALSVRIAGNFNNWRKKPMHRNSHGVWFMVVNPPKGKKTIEYRFVVDGYWTTNPLGENHFRQEYGSMVSYVRYKLKPKQKRARSKVVDNNKIRFAIYMPQAKRITVAGTFNNWNMWQDFLRKSSNGLWVLEKDLPPGEYLYRFYVDDHWRLDLYNPDTRLDHTGQMSSRLVIPED